MLLTDFEYLNNSEEAFKKKIALQIKTLRRQNQVTQEKFYSETNINIARLESGKVDIRLDTLRKVCYYFDVSLSGFFHGIYWSVCFLGIIKAIFIPLFNTLLYFFLNNIQ